MFVNEGAGSGRTARTRATVELARRALRADVHVTKTREPGELAAWLAARMDAYDRAVIAGGDGTLGVAYNVASRQPGLTLGYIPAGFGNASRHLLRLPTRPQEVVAALVAGDARPVDLVAVDGRLALFGGVGWDAVVAGRYAAAGAHRLPGWLAAIGRSVPDLRRRRAVEVRADGEVVHAGPMEFVVVGVTPFYGRGLRVNPGARPDAGRVRVRIYADPPPRFAVEAARWVARTRPHARGIDARRVEVTALDGRALPLQADGDVMGDRATWAFHIRPAAVRLIGRW